MARLSKKARDSLKAQGKWKFETSDKYSAGAEEFAALAREANRIEINPEVVSQCVDFDLAHEPESFSDAWCEIIEDHESYPFQGDIQDGFGYPDSFFPAQSYLIGSAFRVLASSDASLINFSAAFPEVPIPVNQLPFLQSFGEFQRGSDHYKFASVSSEVKSFFRAALQTDDSKSAHSALDRSWLPSSQMDPRLDHILSVKCADFFTKRGQVTGPRAFAGYFFSDAVPPQARVLAQTLDNEERQEFLKLFTSFKTSESFFRLFAKPRALAFLSGLGLEWKDPRPEHLLIERSVHELVLLATERLPQSYLHYRGVGTVPVSVCMGKGSPTQCVTPLRDKFTFLAPPDLSVAEVVASRVFRTRAILGGPDTRVVRRLPFSVDEEFRGPDVDWFHLSTCAFSQE